MASGSPLPPGGASLSGGRPKTGPDSSSANWRTTVLANHRWRSFDSQYHSVLFVRHCRPRTNDGKQLQSHLFHCCPDTAVEGTLGTNAACSPTAVLRWPPSALASVWDATLSSWSSGGARSCCRRCQAAEERLLASGHPSIVPSESKHSRAAAQWHCLDSPQRPSCRTVTSPARCRSLQDR